MGVGQLKRIREAELDEDRWIVEMKDLKLAYREQYRMVKESIDQSDEEVTQRYYEQDR
jgi:hypothetical protein